MLCILVESEIAVIARVARLARVLYQWVSRFLRHVGGSVNVTQVGGCNVETPHDSHDFSLVRIVNDRQSQQVVFHKQF